jgi:hypothetical protein
MKIPFGWLPSSWGLKGSTREIAEAEYTLQGIELDDKIAEIKYRDEEPEILAVAKLRNKKKHSKISTREYDEQHAQLTLTGHDLQIRLLDIQLNRGEIAPWLHATEVAKVKYTGNELAHELLQIDRNYDRINEKQFYTAQAKINFTGKELECELLHVQWRFDDITEREYKIGVAKIMIEPGVDLELELLEIDLNLGLIQQQPYDKKVADVKGEPYICVLNSEYNPDEKLDGLFFEFDWNDKWIEELKAAGYTGFTEDQIVQRWFTDICRGVVQETDQVYQEEQPMPFNSQRIIKKESNPGGPTSYS